MNIRPTIASAQAPPAYSARAGQAAPVAEAPVSQTPEDSLVLSQPLAADHELTRAESISVLGSAGACAGIGALMGAMPVVGTLANIGLGMIHGGKDDVLIGTGVGLLNLAATAAVGSGVSPAIMLAPALASAALWGYHGLMEGFSEVDRARTSLEKIFF